MHGSSKVTGLCLRPGYQRDSFTVFSSFFVPEKARHSFPVGKAIARIGFSRRVVEFDVRESCRPKLPWKANESDSGDAVETLKPLFSDETKFDDDPAHRMTRP